MTKTKTEKDPTCAIFSKNRRFEDIKYDTEYISRISKISRSIKISKKSKCQKFMGATYISDVVFGLLECGCSSSVTSVNKASRGCIVLSGSIVDCLITHFVHIAYHQIFQINQFFHRYQIKRI